MFLMLLYTNLVCLPEFQETAVQFNLMQLTLKSLIWLPKSIWRLEHFSVEELIHHFNIHNRDTYNLCHVLILTSWLWSWSVRILVIAQTTRILYSYAQDRKVFHLPSMLPKSVKSPREHGNSASAILSPSIQCICWVVVVVVLGLAKMIVIIAGIFMPVKKTWFVWLMCNSVAFSVVIIQQQQLFSDIILFQYMVWVLHYTRERER